MQLTPTMLPPSSAVALGGLGMAEIRFRADVLKARAAQFKALPEPVSAETLIREAKISRKAWDHIMRDGVTKVDLTILAKVLTVLKLKLDEVLIYLPDEEEVVKR